MIFKYEIQKKTGLHLVMTEAHRDNLICTTLLSGCEFLVNFIYQNATPGEKTQTFQLEISETESLLNLDFKFSFTCGLKTMFFISVFELHMYFLRDVFQTWRGNEIASPLNYSFISSALSFSPP